MQLAEASQYAAAVLGPIESVEPVQGFVGNQTFRLRAANGATAYLKTGAAIAAESHALENAQLLGIPAPRVLTTDLAVPYLLMAELPGAPSDTPAVVRAAARHLRQLHTVHAEADWPATLQAPVDALDELVPPELADQLRRALPPFLEEVAEVPPALLHGDLHLRHLYADAGQLTGILDWGDSLYGDPLFDVARFTMTADTEVVLAGYGLTPDRELDRIFSQYRILWSLMALRAELAAGGDWIDPHVRRIAAELS
ncbi:phosphotransferase family protein [Kribbella sp. NPDC058245]|uniref:phosphotransferase family protein n=1 Tax=Kribbella sp. NPDC058245 TaxID=3346399 RepID=UPI0036EA46BC